MPLIVAAQLARIAVTKTIATGGAYSANDVVSESPSAGTVWTFSDVVPKAGGGGLITRAQLVIQTGALVAPMTLYLFNSSAQTGAKNDNAANTAPVWADVSGGLYVARIDFPALSSLGGASAAIATPGVGNIPLEFVTASTDNALYGVLVTQAAVTITAGHGVQIILFIEQY